MKEERCELHSLTLRSLHFNSVYNVQSYVIYTGLTGNIMETYPIKYVSVRLWDLCVIAAQIEEAFLEE